MAQMRRATPTSGPGGDANSIPVHSPRQPVSVCEVSILKPKDVKIYKDLKKKILMARKTCKLKNASFMKKTFFSFPCQILTNKDIKMRIAAREAS